MKHLQAILLLVVLLSGCLCCSNFKIPCSNPNTTIASDSECIELNGNEYCKVSMPTTTSTTTSSTSSTTIPSSTELSTTRYSTTTSWISSLRSSTTSTTLQAQSNVKFDLYVMSQCPYAVQLENSLKPVLDLLGNAVILKINYIAMESRPGEFNSLHGESEVNADLLQLCAASYYPSKYFDFIICQNKAIQDIENNWKNCARETGMSSTSIENCYNGRMGTNLLSNSIKASEAAHVGASPSMFINGRQYQGDRDSKSLWQALCAQLKNHPACENTPEFPDSQNQPSSCHG